MRLFLAISLPDNVREKISNSLKDIKNEYKDLRWVGNDNYHITVHFFGDTLDIDKIVPKIEDSLFDTYSFYMYSSECRLFLKRKVFAFLGFSRSKELEKIAFDIDRAFNSQIKIKYVPHLTLARYRIPSKQQYLLLKKKFSNINIDISFKVNKLTLFDCVNYDTKPEYKIIKEFKFIER